MPVTNRLIAPSATLPITESCGPVMPASVIAAVPPGEDARVARLDVGVGAEDGGDPAVEVVRERDLLARRLGVEVDDDHRRLAARLLDELVGGDERALERVEREHPEQVDHRDAVVDGEPAARRARRHVRRPQHAIGAGEVRREALLPPGPVAERDHVGAGGEELLGDLRGDAAPGGGVLPVDDAEVGPELLAQAGQQLVDRPAPGRAEDVGDEEDPQAAAPV